MKFRTEIYLNPSHLQIQYKDPVLLIGSCFTENIGRQMEELLFQTQINPFGVVYNPLSVKRSLEVLISGKSYRYSDLNFFNDLWYSWDHHSSFSGSDKQQVLSNINQKMSATFTFLKTARFLFISFGTAWVYRLKKTGTIVCNCHKVPAKEFERELLDVDKIVQEYKILIEDLNRFNPTLKIIFTVSPVRHWKDGAHGNQVSKSTLHLAIQNIMNEFEDVCDYFPSYEIMIDDLRDYRYYSDDLLHPNEQGIQYIWEKFSDCYFNKKTIGYISGIEDLVRASKHKFTDPYSDSSLKFLDKQYQKLLLLQKELPFLNWSHLSEAFLTKSQK